MNPWRSLKGLRREIWVLCACTLINRAGTMVLPFLVLYLTRHLGYSLTQAGLALSVYGVGSLVSGPVSGLLCDRLGSLRVMKGSLLLSGLLLFPFPWVRGYGALLVLVLVWSMVTEAFRPANLASLTDFALPDSAVPPSPSTGFPSTWVGAWGPPSEGSSPRFPSRPSLWSTAS